MVKNKLGQYFTKNCILRQKVVEYVLNKPHTILEPSVGRGDLVEAFGNGINFEMYEIDDEIDFLPCVVRDDVVLGDFLTQDIPRTYTTIVGNPPYIRTKKGNLYVDFTEKCFELLEDGGELVFIVPSDFFRLTCAVKLLERMMQAGTFTHVFHPHNESMFENASIDVVVYRYCKDPSLHNRVLYNGKNMYVSHQSGLVTFTPNEPSGKMVEELFDAYVGIVSGRDSVFKHALGNIEVLSKDGVSDKFIFITEYPSPNSNINSYLLEHKDELQSRKIKRFDDKNWFEWGAPRNMGVMRECGGEECIYIHTLTRKSVVAFKGKVQYYGGNLIMLKPKVKCDLDKIVRYLNSNEFREQFTMAGRFKIGQRHILKSMIV